MLKKGATLNEFLLIEKLGNGAFGQVWLAENQVAIGNDSKRVALKIPLDQNENLLSEGRNLASLDHPNIVRFYRPGRTNDGLIFLVMEYMQGGSFLDRLKNRGKLTEDEAFDIVFQILHALEYLHGKGYMHMDIKPNNILFDAEGNAKLADFGLAQFVGDKSYISCNAGTIAYMAPEVFNQKARKMSDLWSVGILLHEMLTGENPFRATTIEQLIRKVIMEPPNISAHLSDEIKTIIMKALEKDVRNRYSTPSDMINALESQRIGINIGSAWEKKCHLLTNKDTVLIIVGKVYTIEIDDRPVAMLIQAALINSGRMAFIMTDDEYIEKRNLFANNPVISVGGPIGNMITRELNQTFGIDEKFYKKYGQKIVRVNTSSPVKAVVWGGYAKDTFLAVIEFIKTDLSHFLKPAERVDKIIVSPHTDDAFLFLGGCLVNWRKADEKIKVLNIFSSTNFSSSYIAPQDIQQIATISNFRKVEELANALTVGVQVKFLDFPENLLRTGLYYITGEAYLIEEDNVIADRERSLLENVKQEIFQNYVTEYYFPLAVSEHIDHILIRTIGIEMIKKGMIKKAYFYEDIWPLRPTIKKEVASKDIQDAPSYITDLMSKFGLQVKPHWMEIDIKEVLNMAAVYFSEATDMRGMLLTFKKYLRSSKDGKYYIRYWEYVNQS